MTDGVAVTMSRNNLISDCTLGGVMQPMIDGSERKGGLVCDLSAATAGAWQQPSILIYLCAGTEICAIPLK